MAKSKSLLSIDTPSGWAELVVRTLKVAVIGFVILQVKEYRDAGKFDTLATATDAGMIAGGTFLVNLLLGFRKEAGTKS